jgi:hypothetical protein
MFTVFPVTVAAIFTIFATGAVFTSLAAGSRPYFSVGTSAWGGPPVKRLGASTRQTLGLLRGE